jgi:hypothetical protein
VSWSIPLAGLATFGACLLTHVLLWRGRRPRADVRALFAIFLGVPTLVAASAALAASAPVDVAAVWLLHTALSSAYIQTYPAAQASSPSLAITLAVGRAMPRGLTREELLASGSSADLVETRIEDLVANGLVAASGDRYVMTPSSARLVRFFIALRAVLGVRGRGG